MDPLKTCIFAKNLALSFLATNLKIINLIRYLIHKI